MRSLAVKLILAFLVVSLVGIALVAFLASRITAVEFGNFISEQNQTLIAEQLADYYEANDGWQGPGMPIPRMIDGRGPGAGPGAGRFPFTVTDVEGRILIPGPGQNRQTIIPPEMVQSGQPIEVDGQIVGYVIEPGEFEREQFRTSFSRRVNLSILLAALGAVGFSLLLGVVLSRSLTRPLAELTAATRQMAGGDLRQQVPVRTQDELGTLAASFNQMSAQLDHSQRQRRQMTADIAHDLRTPLSIILGHAEALRDGVLPASQQTFDVLHDEARRLSRLVEDLRTLSLAEAGELTLAPRTVSPQDLLERAYVAHQPQAQEKEIALSLEVTPELPAVWVDPDRMAQVLDNLLGNAIRFTPVQGRITLAARQANGRVQLLVRDTGPGLTAEEQAQVFNRFYRGDRSRQRQEEAGSGLGLAIAKSLVEAHHGRIWAESRPGEGATFLVALPVRGDLSPVIPPDH